MYFLSENVWKKNRIFGENKEEAKGGRRGKKKTLINFFPTEGKIRLK